jgi:hypothetical protein
MPLRPRFRCVTCAYALARTLLKGSGRIHRMTNRHDGESGRVGYLVLYLLGAPIGLLLLLWVLLGNNLIGAG